MNVFWFWRNVGKSLCCISVFVKWRTTNAKTGNGAIPTTPAKDYHAIMICHFIQGNAGTIPNSFKRKGWKWIWWLLAETTGIAFITTITAIITVHHNWMFKFYCYAYEGIGQLHDSGGKGGGGGGRRGGGFPLSWWQKSAGTGFRGKKIGTFMAGIGFVILKNGGNPLSDRNRKPKRKNRLKKRTGIQNSAEFRGIPIGFPNQAAHHNTQRYKSSLMVGR